MRKQSLIVGLIIAVVLLVVVTLADYWSVQSDSNALRLTAVGTISLALATLILAGVAYMQAQDARKQLQETQRAEVRPLVVPTGTLGLEPFSDIAAYWSSLSHAISIANVGNGVAANVLGVMLPLEDAPFPTSNVFFLELARPLAKGEDIQATFPIGGIVLSPNAYVTDGKKRIQLYAHKGSFCYFRLTLSYEDVLGNKHCSVFDHSKNGTWKQIGVLNEITEDLLEIGAPTTPIMGQPQSNTNPARKSA